MENSKPLVSVVIPTYNYGHFVADSIQSALDQTYPNIEVVVVDDGSKDNTQEVLKQFEGKIRNIHKENAGLSAARNTGISESKGEFIAFLDSDDQWLNDKLEKQMEIFLGNPQVGLVSCNGFHVNDDGENVDESQYTDFGSDKVFRDNLIMKNIVSGGSCAVVRKNILDQVGDFDETLKSSEDWDMWLRISQISQIRVLKDKLINIRVGSDNMSSVQHAGRMLENELKVLQKQSELNKDRPQKQLNRGYSYRYFCAAWAFWKGNDRKKATDYIFKSFFKSPLDFLNKKQGGLMVRIIIENILRFHIPVNDFTKPIFNGLYKFHVFVRESWIVFVKVVWFEPLFRSQCEEVGDKLWMEQLPYLVGKGKIRIGNNVRLSGKPNIGFSTKVYSNPELIIGDKTFVGHQTRFAVAQKVEIGSHCYLAGGVVISDNDGHPLNHEDRRRNAPPTADGVKEIVIGDDVWIGRDAVILKGVKIGSRSVIGGRSIVTKDVPEDSVVAGNPAKVIKSLKNES